jgi:hypothetical protein
MLIIGVDFHPEFQQIAIVDTDTGEFQEKRLLHREEAEQFYRALSATGRKVRVGMEASGHARWLERVLAELQFELTCNDYDASLGWNGIHSTRAKWRFSQSACRSVLENCLTPPTLSERRFFTS